MSENSRKTARVQSLRKKLQERRAASGGPKGDFYIVGDAVKDAYSGLFVMDRYHGKFVVVSLGPKSNDTKNPYQEVIRDEIIRPRKKKTYAPKNMSDTEVVALVVSQEGIPADQGTSAQNETPFGLSPASIFGRSNVDHAQRYVPLLWSRLRDDYAYNF